MLRVHAKRYLIRGRCEVGVRPWQGSQAYYRMSLAEGFWIGQSRSVPRAAQDLAKDSIRVRLAWRGGVAPPFCHFPHRYLQVLHDSAEPPGE